VHPLEDSSSPTHSVHTHQSFLRPSLHHSNARSPVIPLMFTRTLSRPGPILIPPSPSALPIHTAVSSSLPPPLPPSFANHSHTRLLPSPHPPRAGDARKLGWGQWGGDGRAGACCLLKDLVKVCVCVFVSFSVFFFFNQEPARRGPRGA
jgi:hypothetical protein